MGGMVLGVETQVMWEAVAFFVIAFLVLRVGFFLIEKFLLKFVVKTKTDVDDLIMKKAYRHF